MLIFGFILSFENDLLNLGEIFNITLVYLLEIGLFRFSVSFCCDLVSIYDSKNSSIFLKVRGIILFTITS